MNRNDSVQYCFRLNLKNPDHLLVHETLMDLNLEIHKSKSVFIIDALINTIKGIKRPDQLTKTGKSLYDSRNEYVTRGEVEDMKLALEKDITREVSKDMISVLLSALSGGNIKLPATDGAEKNISMQNKSSNNREDSETALSDINDMWSDDYKEDV